MFALTLVDHLRLTFGHVIYTHRAHAHIAARLALWNRVLKGAEIFLLLTATITSIVLSNTGQPFLAIVTAVAASAAACVMIVRLVLDLDASITAHRDCSARLWHIREQYRALLSDMKDGTLTLAAARERRDALMNTLRAVYESAPPADRKVYEAARLAVPREHEAVLTDEEVDRFLPVPLQKGSTTAA
jgi:SMODS and SLOG-associating 2TM effector domain family 4